MFRIFKHILYRIFELIKNTSKILICFPENDGEYQLDLLPEKNLELLHRVKKEKSILHKIKGKKVTGFVTSYEETAL
jgi:hypothetical protein